MSYSQILSGLGRKGVQEVEILALVHEIDTLADELKRQFPLLQAGLARIKHSNKNLVPFIYVDKPECHPYLLSHISSLMARIHLVQVARLLKHVRYRPAGSCDT